MENILVLFYESAKLRALRAVVPYMPRVLHALVPHMSRALRALVPLVPYVLRALLLHLPRALRALVPQCFVPCVFSCSTCLVPCASRASCLTSLVPQDSNVTGEGLLMFKFEV